jgi:hypothetical protein
MAMNIVIDKNSLERVEVCCVLEIVIDKFQMVSSSTPIKMNIIHRTAFPPMVAEMPNSERASQPLH